MSEFCSGAVEKVLNMISINREFQSLIPRLSSEEYSQLETNIVSDGCRDALVVWLLKGEPILIDGHNRYEICQKHNLSFKTVEQNFDSSEDAKLWIIKNQFGRRNISDFVRAELALQAEPLIAARAKERQACGQGGILLPVNLPEATRGETRDELSTMSGVSARNISKVKNILASGHEDLVNEVRGNNISINAAEIISAMDINEQHEILEDIKGGEKPSEAINKHVLATKHTGDEESYTPPVYIESARAVMGKFDLDPASNEMAQQNINADNFYTIDDDGLTKEWRGKVWMNPPYTARVINIFISKLVSHFEAGEVTEAIVLTNNNTDTSWFHEAANTASAICFTSGRINFLKRDGSKSSPTNGQSFIYFGNNQEAFKEVFSQHGLVMVKA